MHWITEQPECHVMIDYAVMIDLVIMYCSAVLLNSQSVMMTGLIVVYCITKQPEFYDDWLNSYVLYCSITEQQKCYDDWLNRYAKQRNFRLIRILTFWEWNREH